MQDDRQSYYGLMAEKKDKKTTIHLLYKEQYMYMYTCRVGFFSFFPAIVS